MILTPVIFSSPNSHAVCILIGNATLIVHSADGQSTECDLVSVCEPVWPSGKALGW